MAIRNAVATDNFNRADSTNNLGANWTDSTPSGDIGISSNQAYSSSVNDNVAYWSANSFANNHYSKATVAAVDTTSASSKSGLLVRANGSDYVMAQDDRGSNRIRVFWYNGGAYTQIGSTFSGTFAATDEIVFEAIGTTFKFIKNGICVVSGANASAPSSGAPGILMIYPNERLDNWEGGDMGVVSKITSGSDDAEEATGGSPVLDSGDLEFTNDGGTQQVVGIRFPSIAIPNGATVTSAVMRLVVDENQTGANDVDIYAEATDDAATFTTTNGNVDGRSLTTATVNWDFGTTDASTVSQIVESPELTSIVQELVNRAGWVSGNDIAFIIKNGHATNRRTFFAYDGNPGNAPEFFYTYTSSSTVVKDMIYSGFIPFAR